MYKAAACQSARSLILKQARVRFATRGFASLALKHDEHKRHHHDADMSVPTKGAGGDGTSPYLGNWSQILSFVTPESDFVSPSWLLQNNDNNSDSDTANNAVEYAEDDAKKHKNCKTKQTIEWSEHLSFASPESDFCASYNFALPEVGLMASTPRPETTLQAEEQDETVSKEPESFATPESPNDEFREPEWSQSLSFASPESDFCFPAPLFEHEYDWLKILQTPVSDMLLEDHHEQQQEEKQHLMFNQNEYQAVVLSMLESPESAIGYVEASERLNERLQRQHMEACCSCDNDILCCSKHQLPESLAQVAHDERPVVVTRAQAPFEIVMVNDAWVRLCGYSKEEAINKTLGGLLQGPETNKDVAKRMIRHVLDSSSAIGDDALLTNYTKNGRKFSNHLRVGHLQADNLLVGVLTEVVEEKTRSPIKMAA